ncbi:hypothetical protein ADIARSV_3818 [Arcticibacter svalbardensis MN12-7]|uniref:Uncharacterized protein n=1 Tax=Arcticibacter svalbardensis MN12-7 TaxID=1150600 RepID=R9GMR1_9SPHI|nr:hypothetical protein ADIARSV_3818 [Arcticibacter svalbardensis MN12-7]
MVIPEKNRRPIFRVVFIYWVIFLIYNLIGDINLDGILEV